MPSDNAPWRSILKVMLGKDNLLCSVNYTHQNQKKYHQNILLIPRGEIIFLPDVPCKVEIEIQHEWKQEITRNI